MLFFQTIEDVLQKAKDYTMQMLRDGFIEIGIQDQDLQIKKEVNSAQAQMKK